MQKWYLSVALACGCTVALVNSASAQNADERLQREVEALQRKIAVIQAQNAAGAAQVQILPAQAQPVQVQADVAVARIMPGPGIGIGNNGGLAQADAAFVGRVVAFEPKDIEAPQFPGGPNVKYRVALVQVSDAIFGLKKGTEQVRVAFVPQAGFNPGGPGGIVPPGGVQIQPAIQPAIQPIGGRRPFPGNFQVQLQMGQEGFFAVSKHHKEAFFLSPNSMNFLDRANPSFDGQVKTAKQLSKVMGDPVAALKSDDKDDRYTAATVLLTKYRSNPTGQPVKTEQIDAEESKLILKAIAGGNWEQKGFGGAIPAPYEIFYQIGAQPKDGFNMAGLRTPEEQHKAMQKWLTDNQDKFRIEKLVVDPTAKTPIIRPGGGPIKLPPGGGKVLPGGGAGGAGGAGVPAPRIEIDVPDLPRDLPLPVPPPAPVPAPPVQRN